MHKLISWARVGLALLWTFVTAWPFLVLLLLLLPWRRLRVIVAAWYGRTISWGSFKIFGITPVYEHLERLADNAPCIVIANHSSNIDPFLAIWHNPIGGVGVAKRQIVWIPVFGQMYILSGHLLLHREDPARAVSALAETADMMRRHQMGICMWPEGTMPPDGRLLPFKKGVVHLALATRLPIVPVVVHDAHLRWPARTLDIRPGPLRVEVLEPVDTTGWTRERTDEHLAALHALFVEALAPHQRPLPA